MFDLTLIGVPYHLGARGIGVGRGPLELLGADAIPDALRSAGRDVEVVWLDDPRGAHEVGRVFELDRAIAGVVTTAREGGRLPLIVSGNCIACLGAIGGIGAHRTGIVWLDAHPDFNTPETTESGFLDGMGLAAATGGAWRALTSSIPGFRPVLEEDTVLIGARDIDPAERERLDSGEVTMVEVGAGPGSLPLAELERAIEAIADRVDGVYLHVDFDALDPSLGRPNEHAVDGGLGLEDVRSTVSAVAARTPILAVSFTAYDPDEDSDRRFRAAAVEIVANVVEASS